jgi:hypothetical protein
VTVLCKMFTLLDSSAYDRGFEFHSGRGSICALFLCVVFSSRSFAMGWLFIQGDQNVLLNLKRPEDRILYVRIRLLSAESS